MLASELPTNAVLVSPGVWTDAVSRARYYLDPTDPTLLVSRPWTPAEVRDYDAAQDTAAQATAALKQAIGDRVILLQEEAAAITIFQTGQTTRAAEVAGYPVEVITIAAIQAEMVQMHRDLALVSKGLVQGLTDTADLATVVSGAVSGTPA